MATNPEDILREIDQEFDERPPAVPDVEEGIDAGTPVPDDEDEATRRDLREEIEDRFGPVPPRRRVAGGIITLPGGADPPPPRRRADVQIPPRNELRERAREMVAAVRQQGRIARIAKRRLPEGSSYPELFDSDVTLWRGKVLRKDAHYDPLVGEVLRGEIEHDADRRDIELDQAEDRAERRTGRGNGNQGGQPWWKGGLR